MKDKPRSPKAIVYGINAALLFALLKVIPFDIKHCSWWWITAPVAFTFIAAFIYVNKKSRS